MYICIYVAAIRLKMQAWVQLWVLISYWWNIYLFIHWFVYLFVHLRTTDDIFIYIWWHIYIYIYVYMCQRCGWRCRCKSDRECWCHLALGLLHFWDDQLCVCRCERERLCMQVSEREWERKRENERERGSLGVSALLMSFGSWPFALLGRSIVCMQVWEREIVYAGKKESAREWERVRERERMSGSEWVAEVI